MAPDDGVGGGIGPAKAETGTLPADLSRMIVAEAAGSGLLAFIVVASGILAERFAINNASVTLLITALTGAAALMVLSWALGFMAPAYFNPALALAFTLSGRIRPQTGLLCAAAQIAAAFLGVMIAHIVTNTGLVQVATLIHTGEGVWLGEFLATMLFIFALLTLAETALDRLPLTAAACLLAILLATPSTSFANPALTLARALTDSFMSIRLIDALIIACLQMLAALCAFGARAWLARR